MKLMLRNNHLSSSELDTVLNVAGGTANEDENSEGLNMGAIEAAVIQAINRVREVLKLFPTEQQRYDKFWSDVKLNPMNDINRHLQFQTGPQFVPGVTTGVNFTKPLSQWKTAQLSRGVNKMADYITQDIEPKIAARQGDKENTRVLSRYLAASTRVIDSLVEELAKRGETAQPQNGGGFVVTTPGTDNVVTWPFNPGGGGGASQQPKTGNLVLPLIIGAALLTM